MKKNCWHPVENHPELLVGQYLVPNFVSNSIAIKVSDTELVLISPGQPLLAPWQAQFPRNIKLHIMFPNAYHHMGVNAWLAAYDDVTLYASNIAKQQLMKKGFTQVENLSLETTTPPLPQDYDILFPPGHRAGDVWVRKQLPNQAASTWITCDSFLNYERMSNQPIARFMQRILGAAPNLKISQVVKWFILSDRRSFKGWALKQLKEDNPTTLIPSHGEIRSDNHLSENISKVIKQRL